MKIWKTVLFVLLPGILCAKEMRGYATWYGEEHRGRIMANRQPFNPDKPTCASWFYPLGTKLQVTSNIGLKTVVTVTDRGPRRDLIRRRGVIIDLASSAFDDLAGLPLGRIYVTVRPIK